MNSLVKERDQSEIFVLNNLEVQSQIKSSILQSKLQQSIQNIRQLTKPIAMHIESQILPLHKPDQQTPIKKCQHQKLNSDGYSTQTKGSQIENKVEYTKKSVQNQFDFSYSYRKQENQMIKSTDYQRIFEHYNYSSIVQMISSYEECFKILEEYNEAQLLRIPSNLILAILKEREELQHQCVLLRRKLYQLDRVLQQND